MAGLEHAGALAMGKVHPNTRTDEPVDDSAWVLEGDNAVPAADSVYSWSRGGYLLNTWCVKMKMELQHSLHAGNVLSSTVYLEETRGGPQSDR